MDGGLWSYQVDYSYSNGKPYVRAISKCSESDCLSPFTPKWSPTSSGFGAMGKKLNNFSITQGWRTTHEPRFMSDADGDGIADIIAFGAGGVWVSLADGNGGFKEPLKALLSKLISLLPFHMTRELSLLSLQKKFVVCWPPTILSLISLRS